MLTGRGAGIIIIDDPLKPEEVLSQTQRQAANDWFDHTLYSRLNDTRSGAIIVIMHRLHEDDLAGHVMAQEDWDVVRLPSITEEDEIWALDSELGQYVFTRLRGEALHPERQPVVSLAKVRRTIGEYNLPASTSRHHRRRAAAWSKPCGSAATPQMSGPTSSTRSCRAGTPPTRPPRLSDFSVCTSWGIKGKDLYLLNVLRRRMEYPELKRAARTGARTAETAFGDGQKARHPPGVIRRQKRDGAARYRKPIAARYWEQCKRAPGAYCEAARFVVCSLLYQAYLTLKTRNQGHGELP